MSGFERCGDIPGSFRDPGGAVFCKDGVIYRRVNDVYRDSYDHLMSSGFYRELTAAGLLVGHEEVPLENECGGKTYRVIRPEKITFISYPYEWSFSQLKDAALAILEIQKRALDFGMTLKDASAYNMQFKGSRPVLIDTLSFEKYREGEPWVAYRQYCQHFLAVLALMSMKDIRLSQLLKIYIDGIPLDMASALLPVRTYFRFSLLSHIHLHAGCQSYFSEKGIAKGGKGIRKGALSALIGNLERSVRCLTLRPKRTLWARYYEEAGYSKEAFELKKRLVSEFLDEIKPGTVWDMGANTGVFSRIAGARGICTVSFEEDPYCVEESYIECKKGNGQNILPLVMDVKNPSPAIGWEGRERASLLERGPADTVFALALIHHLAISNNVPMDMIAGFFGRICRNWLIIEYVPKSDPKAKRLLAFRNDDLAGYSEESFGDEFGKYFTVIRKVRINGTERTLYLMRRNQRTHA